MAFRRWESIRFDISHNVLTIINLNIGMQLETDPQNRNIRP